MARNASARLMHTIARLLRVTSFALQARVRAGQWEMSLPIMIERPTSPSHRVMASPAIRSEPSFMAIVVTVTRRTLLRRILEATRLMTGSTCGVGVFANQGKASQSVVEPHRGRPAGVTVALFTLRAFLTGVRIIVTVTRYAGHGEVHLARRLNVTLLTGQAGMSAAQREVRLPGVIETGAPPIGLRMTLLASGTIAPLVRTLIVGAVTRQAIRRQAHLASGLYVARGALNGRVTPAQWKTCSAVVKALSVPIDR
jgi:hypothetical protein